MTCLSPSFYWRFCCSGRRTLYLSLCQNAWQTAGWASASHPGNRQTMMEQEHIFLFFLVFSTASACSFFHQAKYSKGKKNNHLGLIVVLAPSVGNLGQDVFWLLIFGIAEHHLDHWWLKLRQGPNTRPKLLQTDGIFKCCSLQEMTATVNSSCWSHELSQVHTEDACCRGACPHLNIGRTESFILNSPLSCKQPGRSPSVGAKSVLLHYCYKLTGPFIILFTRLFGCTLSDFAQSSGYPSASLSHAFGL